MSIYTNNSRLRRGGLASAAALSSVNSRTISTFEPTSRTLIELARIHSRPRELFQLTRVPSPSMLFESTGFEALRLHWVEACMHVHFERACPKQRSKRVRRSGRSNGFEALRSHWLEATCSRSQARAFQCTGRASISISLYLYISISLHLYLFEEIAMSP